MTITNTFNVLSDIEASTGLKVSYEKTTMYRIGSLSNTNAHLFTLHKVHWANDFVNTLGVDISSNPNVWDHNIKTVIAKLKVVSKMWYHRCMTLMGKVEIVNALMGSLFVYKLQVLQLLNRKMVKEIEDTIHDFIWNGKREKIPLSTLQARKEDGGLGLINIELKHHSLTCAWVLDCKNNAQIANLATAMLNVDNINEVWMYNLNGNDCKTVFPGNSFWHEVVCIWHEYRFHDPQNKENVEKQSIWNNSHIKVNDRVLNYKAWRSKDVKFVCQLFDDCGNTLSYEMFKTQTGISVNWLDFQTVICAIPIHWLFFVRNPGRNYAYAYVSLQLRVQNAVPAQPCVGKLGISLVLLNFLHCNFRLWFKTP